MAPRIRLRGQASMCCSTPPTGCNGNGVGREGVVGRVAANAVRTPSTVFRVMGTAQGIGYESRHTADSLKGIER